MADPNTTSPPVALELEGQIESLRAQFAAFANHIQEVEIASSTGRDWGHMRAVILARLSGLRATATKMAAGQPAYVPTYKIRAEKAEAEVERLRADRALFRSNRCGLECGIILPSLEM